MLFLIFYKAKQVLVGVRYHKNYANGSEAVFKRSQSYVYHFTPIYHQNKLAFDV